MLGIVFATEAGYYWFEWANHYIIFILTLVGCAECIGLTWIRCVQTTLSDHACTDQASLKAVVVHRESVQRTHPLSEDIQDMIKRPISGIWIVMWKIVCPVVCFLLFFTGLITELATDRDPELWGSGMAMLGWWMALGPLLFMMTWFVWGPGEGAQYGRFRPPPRSAVMTRELTRGTTAAATAPRP